MLEKQNKSSVNIVGKGATSMAEMRRSLTKPNRKKMEELIEPQSSNGDPNKRQSEMLKLGRRFHSTLINPASLPS